MRAGPDATEPPPEREAACLYGHNRTEPTPTSPSLVGSPVLQVWSRGSSVRVSTGKASWAEGPKDHDAALLGSGPATDRLAAVSRVTRRGAVGTLSERSQSRLRQTLSTIDQAASLLFCTMTWPNWPDREGWHPPTREEWHGSWNRFRKRLSRSWPMAKGVWRREYTKAGVTHLHLLLFHVQTDRETVLRFRSWIAAAWADSVDLPDYDKRLAGGTSVEVPRSGAAVSKYVSKYVSKTAEGDYSEQPMGRWWGTFGSPRTAKPNESPLFTKPDDYPLTLQEAHAVRRTMERWLSAKRRAAKKHTVNGSKHRRPMPRKSRRVFTDKPDDYLRMLALLRQPSQIANVSRAVSAGVDAKATAEAEATFNP